MREIRYRFSKHDEWTLVSVEHDKYEEELQYWRERTFESGGEVK